MKLRFKNTDAREKDLTLTVDPAAVAHIARWYGAFCAGDRYRVYIDGKHVRTDQNGEIVGWTAEGGAA